MRKRKVVCSGGFTLGTEHIRVANLAIRLETCVYFTTTATWGTPRGVAGMAVRKVTVPPRIRSQR